MKKFKSTPTRLAKVREDHDSRRLVKANNLHVKKKSY